MKRRLEQRLVDRAPVGPHAAQQQLLAFLAGPPEFEPEKDRNQDEDDGQERCLRRERPFPGGCVAVFQLSAVQRYPKLA